MQDGAIKGGMGRQLHKGTEDRGCGSALGEEAAKRLLVELSDCSSSVGLHGLRLANMLNQLYYKFAQIWENTSRNNQNSRKKKSIKSRWIMRLLEIHHSNIQMQYSKVEGRDLISKIERLKKEIDAAGEYTALEKCTHRLERLKEKAAAVLERQKRKELKEMCEVAEGLIRLKTKKFKKKIIQQIRKESPEYSPKSQDKAINHKEKTLAYSKSVDCFNLPAPQKPVPKHQKEDSLQDQTEVHAPKRGKRLLQRRVEELEEQLESYKRQMNKLEKGRSSATLTQFCLRLSEQEGLFEQQLSFKAREKALEADQLRERLRKSQERSIELKNRLFNEQKRQQDYIQGLKSQLSSITQQMQLINRQNKKLQQELNKVYFVCDGYKAEAKRLMQDVNQLQREKRQIQQNEIIKMKDNGIRRELEVLQLQEKYMRQIESLLPAEKDENGVLQSQVEQFEKRSKVLQQQIAQLQVQNERLQDMLEIKEEEAAQIKKEMLIAIEGKNAYGQELFEARSHIAQLQDQITINKQRRNLELQKKAQNLKQIKEILQAK